MLLEWCSLVASLLGSAAPQDALSSTPDPTLIVHDVSELVASAVERMPSGESPEDRGKQACANLAGIVEAFVTPPLESPRHSVRPIGDAHLAVLGTQEQQRWVERFLAIQRKRPAPTFEIEWQMMVLPEGSLDLAEWSEPRLMTAERARELVEGWARQEGTESIGSVRATLRAGERASIEALTTRTYIKDYRVWEKVEPQGTRLVDPIIDQVAEGVEGSVVAVLVPDEEEGERIGVEFEIEGTQIIALRRFESKLGIVGLPELRRAQIASKVVVRPSTSVVYVASQHIVAILTIRRGQ